MITGHPLRRVVGCAQIVLAGLWVAFLVVAVCALVAWSVLEDWIKRTGDVQ